MTLDTLGLKFGTDKASNHHNYLGIYEKYLNDIRFLPICVLELGVGGYDYPDRGGESLKMWREYFRNAHIVGIDINQKTGLEGNRVYFEKGDQVDLSFLMRVNQKHGPFDLMIDDASHVNGLTIRSFLLLFPMLKPGGLYIVEDVHTSFFEDNGFGGDRDPEGEGYTTLKWFQKLVPQLYSKTLSQEFQNSFFDQMEYIHFYENLVFIKKK